MQIVGVEILDILEHFVYGYWDLLLQYMSCEVLYVQVSALVFAV